MDTAWSVVVAVILFAGGVALGVGVGRDSGSSRVAEAAFSVVHDVRLDPAHAVNREPLRILASGQDVELKEQWEQFATELELLVAELGAGDLPRGTAPHADRDGVDLDER